MYLGRLLVVSSHFMLPYTVDVLAFIKSALEWDHDCSTYILHTGRS